MYKINYFFRNNVLFGGSTPPATRYNYIFLNMPNILKSFQSGGERWGEGELNFAGGFLSLGCVVFFIIAIVKLILYSEAVKKKDEQTRRENKNYGLFFILWAVFCCCLMLVFYGMDLGDD